MDHVTHLGLDVHKDTIAVAILRPDQNVPDERVIPNTPEALRKLVARRHLMLLWRERIGRAMQRDVHPRDADPRVAIER